MNCSFLHRFLTRTCFLACAVSLVSCATQPAAVPDSEADDQILQIRPLPTAQRSSALPDNESRLIADLLFAGLQALDADRLLTPVDDSAHGRFQRVLAYDPDNEIALQGLQDIVLRYVELAEDASRQGLFEEAAGFLDRARFVDDTHPAIAAAAAVLENERASGDLFFVLDGNALRKQTAEIQQEIAMIARQAREHEAFFLITAPSDDLARWIFGVMRAAVPGYRLRGNIELAGRSGVRLRLPRTEE